jgi:hypothetical protein
VVTEGVREMKRKREVFQELVKGNGPTSIIRVLWGCVEPATVVSSGVTRTGGARNASSQHFMFQETSDIQRSSCTYPGFHHNFPFEGIESDGPLNLGQPTPGNSCRRVLACLTTSDP